MRLDGELLVDDSLKMIRHRAGMGTLVRGCGVSLASDFAKLIPKDGFDEKPYL